MSEFDDLCDEVQDNTKNLKIFNRKMWVFEWFLFFLMIYMCCIAYSLYTLRVDVIGMTTPTQFIFP